MREGGIANRNVAFLRGADHTVYSSVNREQCRIKVRKAGIERRDTIEHLSEWS